MSFQAIADAEARQTGRPPRRPEHVARDMRDWLKDRGDLYAEEKPGQVQLEQERLDRVQRAAEQVLRSEQAAACGVCGRHPDPALVLRAVDRVLRVLERRSQLLALDESPRERQAPPPVEDELARRRREARGA